MKPQEAKPIGAANLVRAAAAPVTTPSPTRGEVEELLDYTCRNPTNQEN